MKTLLTVVVIFLAAIISNAVACETGFTAPPKTLDSIYSNADRIFYGSVNGISTIGDKSQYTFSVIKNIKGKTAANYSLSVRSNTPNNFRDFNGHRNLMFWDRYVTRAVLDSDCHESASFKLGHSYVIFHSDKDKTFGFEEVKSVDDLWYQSLVAIGKHEEHGVPVQTYFNLQTAIALVEVTSCQSEPYFNVIEQLKTHKQFTMPTRYLPKDLCVIGKQYLLFFYHTEAVVYEENYHITDYQVLPLLNGKIQLADISSLLNITYNSKEINLTNIKSWLSE